MGKRQTRSAFLKKGAPKTLLLLAGMADIPRPKVTKVFAALFSKSALLA
jgi:hypothetical protein